MTEVGFCEKCHLVRQDDAYGPVTPCACFVDHHAHDCRLRITIRSPIAIEHDHEDDAAVPCTCGVAADRMFVCGARVFTWEPKVGLVPKGS